MIKLLRVDHRLLHGQVAMTWTQELDTNCILIACDAVVKDDVRKTTLKLARPAGVKLVIKSVDDSIEALRSGVTDKYRLFIVVESIEDAYRLAKGYSEIEHINIGGTKPREGADVRLSSTVFATDRDVELLYVRLLRWQFRQRLHEQACRSQKCICQDYAYVHGRSSE